MLLSPKDVNRTYPSNEERGRPHVSPRWIPSDSMAITTCHCIYNLNLSASVIGTGLSSIQITRLESRLNRAGGGGHFATVLKTINELREKIQKIQDEAIVPGSPLASYVQYHTCFDVGLARNFC